jgi:hypothetical protein
MATQTCIKCSKTFNSKYTYNKHLNKKNDCSLKYKYKEKQNCQYCNKLYYSKYTLSTHQKKCNSMIIYEENKILENKLKEIEKKIDQPVIQTNILTTNNNNNNTNTNSNNTINNNINIQILPFDKTNKYLSDIQISQILGKGYKSIEEFITAIHFNKDHPENHNLYISNNRDKYINVYDGIDWKLQEKNDVVDRLYTDNTDYLIDKFNDLLDELDKTTINKFNRFKNDFEGDTNIENIKENIKLLLYNNRKIIEDTKKLNQCVQLKLLND